MIRSRSIFRASALLFVGALAAGCARGESVSAPAPGAMAAAAPTPAMVEEGRALFSGAGTCQVCHGAGGTGGRSGPSLADATWLWVNAESPTLWNDLTQLIRVGVPQPRQAPVPMPGFEGRLTDDQMRAIAAYVMSL